RSPEEEREGSGKAPPLPVYPRPPLLPKGRGGRVLGRDNRAHARAHERGRARHVREGRRAFGKRYIKRYIWGGMRRQRPRGYAGPHGTLSAVFGAPQTGHVLVGGGCTFHG